MFKRGVIILLLLVIRTISFAQEYIFKNVSTHDGLPSNECYEVFSDRRGYLWFRTMNGICRYNGLHIKLYGRDEGLRNLPIYALHEDRLGRLWFSDSHAQIGYIFNDSICYVSSSALISALLNYGQEDVYAISSNANLDILLTSYERTLKISAASGYRQVTTVASDHDVFFQLMACGERLFPLVTFYSDQSYPENFAKNQAFTVDMLGCKRSVDWNINLSGGGFRRFITACRSRSGDIFFSSDVKKLYAFTRQDSSLRAIDYEKNVLTCFIDSKNNLWVGLRSGGLRCYPNCSISSKPACSLSNLSISSVCEDVEGGIWASTLEKGIFYCPGTNNNIHHVGSESFRPELLKVVGETLFISDFKNGLFSMDLRTNKIRNHLIKKNKRQDGYRHILGMQDGYALINRNEAILTDSNLTLRRILNFYKCNTPQNSKLPAGKSHRCAKDFSSYGGYRLAQTANAHLYGVSKSHIVNYTTGRLIPLNAKGNDLCFFNDTLFVACKDSLYKLVGNALKRVSIPDYLTDIIRLEQSKQFMLLASREKGLYSLDKHGVVRKLGSYAGRINDACLLGDSLAVLGTNYGMYVLNLLNGKETHYTQDQGLEDNEIFFITSFKHHLYYSTKTGVASLSFNRDDLPSPRLYISKRLFNDSLPFPCTNRFPAGSKLCFNLDLVSFANAREITVYYRLKPEDAWRKTDAHQLVLDYLSSGNYSLELKAEHTSGKSSGTLNYPFTIDKAYYETWWFRLGIVLLLGSVIFVTHKLSSHLVLKRTEAKANVTRLITKYQLESLRAQMNPHFIFNSLNSIQNYIFSRKQEETFDYVNRFSRLVRQVLSHSSQTFISLKDDLEVINLYIELEQKRVENRFDYQLDIDKTIDIHAVQIPPLLLQPYVENAIWHGLMPLARGSRARLTIAIKPEGDYITIRILDNGIGRKKSEQRRLKTHTSKGTTLTEKRIEAINLLLGAKNLSVSIYDLEPAGTEVVISLRILEDD